MCSIYFLPTDFVPNVKDSNKSRFKKRSESNEAARQKTVLRDNAVPSNFPNAASYFSTLKQVRSFSNSLSEYLEEVMEILTSM